MILDLFQSSFITRYSISHVIMMSRINLHFIKEGVPGELNFQVVHLLFVDLKSQRYFSVYYFYDYDESN